MLIKKLFSYYSPIMSWVSFISCVFHSLFLICTNNAHQYNLKQTENLPEQNNLTVAKADKGRSMAIIGKYIYIYIYIYIYMCVCVHLLL